MNICPYHCTSNSIWKNEGRCMFGRGVSQGRYSLDEKKKKSLEALYVSEDCATDDILATWKREVNVEKHQTDEKQLHVIFTYFLINPKWEHTEKTCSNYSYMTFKVWNQLNVAEHKHQ